MKKIAILGSTGSVGTQTLEIVRNYPELEVVALTAGSNIDLLEAQIREFHPKFVCIEDEDIANDLLLRTMDCDVKVAYGMDGLIECATLPSVEMIVVALVGMIGIRPTIEAIKAGKDIALANKETLVTAGHIIMPLVAEKKVRLLPVDSEHSAIFQSLQGSNKKELEKIILTASGGPFRGKKREDLTTMKAEHALKHPNWSMGRKITIDSATMVNKGLEVIEARWLFDVPADKIEVVIQPQSILHSAVQFCDGGIIAQMGIPDMKLPIQYALFYPERRELKLKRVDFFELGSMIFEKPDMDTFRGLKLAYDAINIGGSMPTVYNAANEYAVAKFLNNEISFLKITELIEAAMNHHKVLNNPDLKDILNTESETYAYIAGVY